jgi:phosphonatase-like hydrolase
MRQKIKLAVFDMAGTTIKDNSNVAGAFQQAFLMHGVSNVTLEEAQEKMGYPKPLAIKEILKNRLKNKSLITDELISKIHDEFVKNMIQYYKTSPGIAPMEDAEEVFEALKKQGISIGIDTGFSRDIADTIFKRIGWSDNPLIDFTVCSDEVERGRPYPDMIELMMEKLGIEDTKEVIKIGDTEVDINQGHNSGCLMSIGVTTGAFTKEALLPHQPTYIVNSLKEILPLLKKVLNQDGQMVGQSIDYK